jgi:hypothetical protein
VCGVGLIGDSGIHSRGGGQAGEGKKDGRKKVWRLIMRLALGSGAKSQPLSQPGLPPRLAGSRAVGFGFGGARLELPCVGHARRRAQDEEDRARLGIN